MMMMPTPTLPVVTRVMVRVVTLSDTGDTGGRQKEDVEED
jgi:hypothetical protein